METKICGSCKTEKPLIDFYYRKDKNRYISYCSNCKKEKKKKWDSKNFNRNKCENNCRSRKHYQDNRERYKLLGDNWKKLNIESHRKYKNEWEKNKRKNSASYRILCALRTRLINALKGKTKSVSTIKLLGCAISTLKTHLQNQFQNGMTFKNYGKWQIDHIKPCASFDLSDTNQQKVCFHYTNLQPLWAIDNIRKGKN